METTRNPVSDQMLVIAHHLISLRLIVTDCEKAVNKDAWSLQNREIWSVNRTLTVHLVDERGSRSIVHWGKTEYSFLTKRWSICRKFRWLRVDILYQEWEGVSFKLLADLSIITQRNCILHYVSLDGALAVFDKLLFTRILKCLRIHRMEHILGVVAGVILGVSRAIVSIGPQPARACIN